jgi:hypothetical protein
MGFDGSHSENDLIDNRLNAGRALDSRRVRIKSGALFDLPQST